MNICPVNAVAFEDNPLDGKIAIVSSEKCIDCGMCYKTCPVNEWPEMQKTKICYAGWSMNNDVRKKSASGGIAAELYKYYLNKGCWIAGCEMDEQFSAKISLRNTGYSFFQNSKYVYSDMGDTFTQIERVLKEKNEVLFVGLPCQVSGLRKYLQIKGINTENLLCVDLICHGVIQAQWLKDYVRSKEKKTKKKASHIAFRDYRFGTQNFVLTLGDDEDIFFAAPVNRTDEYQIAYHRGVAYRNNCYNCFYAQENRTGDITLGDFTGVGTEREFLYEKQKISCVLVNSKKAFDVLNEMKREGYIFLDERPISEEYNREQRLHTPTPVPSERKRFLMNISRGKSFGSAIRSSMKLRMIKNEIKAVFAIRGN
ncbi:Coenzyme F420-reducing hydrogenase, beta subunit [Butyrivibrio fibrisolvens DSM 3071]|uniref:Coenzyme F420-reducing hydrogenase, beta subunit n=1 Tax=Butyrivibrio fibrisolvens DSM 3071 TaxID=1121131 RepID=A0A1M5Z7L0_BUTFI|nr:Coenzyme F420-reducing hydrogenase, beta subunit [Butyrivibrio fibrisolvens DSM 3071]